MFHGEFWKPTCFGIKRSKVKVTSHNSRRGSLHSCDCWLILVEWVLFRCPLVSLGPCGVWRSEVPFIELLGDWHVDWQVVEGAWSAAERTWRLHRRPIVMSVTSTAPSTTVRPTYCLSTPLWRRTQTVCKDHTSSTPALSSASQVYMPPPSPVLYIARWTSPFNTCPSTLA